MHQNKRIHLSAPHMGGLELPFVEQVFEENWVSTAGPQLGQFEQALCHFTGAGHAAALSSGTAALHLALLVLGVQPGDEVICSTFTFSASANPIVYCGATPVFVESEPGTWNMAPEALEEAIQDRLRQGKKPRAILLVHLYGMPAQLNELLQIAQNYDIPVIEDAAEALGSTYHGRQAGTFGTIGVYSFNGNKIITTSGGGALVSDEEAYVEQAKFLATQAKDPAPHYQHSRIGYNYRLSNVCAGIGLGQMQVLEQRIQQRRQIHQFYRERLRELEAVRFLPEPAGFYSNRWLTCILLSSAGYVTCEELRLHLEVQNIDSRPLWKPLHLQPVFQKYPYYGNRLSERLFEQGLCLPSGTGLTEAELETVAAAIVQKMTLK